MSEPSDSDQAVDGGTAIDTAVPSGGSDHLRPRRRWRGPVALGAALAVGVGGTLLAVRPWEDDAKVPAATGAADTQPGSGDGAAASRPDIPERRLVLDPVPEGLGALYIQDPARDPEQFQGMPEPGYAILLRAPGADYATGPWLSVGTQDLANFGGTFDPQNFFSGNNPRSVQIGEFRGAVGQGFNGDTLVTFGPTGPDDQLAVSLQAKGISEAQLLQVAAGVQLRDRRPLLDETTLPIEMEVLMATDHAMNGSDPTSVIYDWTSTVSVNYGPVDAGFGSDGSARFVTLTNRLAGDDDALALAAFFLTDAEATTVGGKPAVMGTTDALQGFGTASIVWLDGDDVVNLSASESMGDIAALAETVRPATEAEWDELDAETKANQERQQAIQEEASRTWFIDAGDLDDSTTWLAEGTFDEAGAFLAAASEMSGNGSSFGNGSGIGSGAAEIPSLQLQTSGSLSSIVFALGPLDRPDAVLRVVLDDGTVLERPLHAVRPDWPALAAAIGYDNSRSGTAELVTADGTVLDRLALDAAPGQPGARGTDVTVAAASG